MLRRKHDTPTPCPCPRSDNSLTCLLRRGPDGDVVDPPHVLHDVHHEVAPKACLVRMEVEHVPNGAVGQGGAEDGDVVLVAPIVDRVLVVDLLPQPAKGKNSKPGRREPARPSPAPFPEDAVALQRDRHGRASPTPFPEDTVAQRRDRRGSRLLFCYKNPF